MHKSFCQLGGFVHLSPCSVPMLWALQLREVIEAAFAYGCKMPSRGRLSLVGRMELSPSMDVSWGWLLHGCMPLEGTYTICPFPAVTEANPHPTPTRWPVPPIFLPLGKVIRPVLSPFSHALVLLTSAALLERYPYHHQDSNYCHHCKIKVSLWLIMTYFSFLFLKFPC